MNFFSACQIFLLMPGRFFQVVSVLYADPKKLYMVMPKCIRQVVTQNYLILTILNNLFYE
jgi:hypothetical protein